MTLPRLFRGKITEIIDDKVRVKSESIVPNSASEIILDIREHSPFEKLSKEGMLVGTQLSYRRSSDIYEFFIESGPMKGVVYCFSENVPREPPRREYYGHSSIH